jgi:hypothetical protein
MARWLSILLTALLGLAFGLVYGWIIDPVQYTDTTPDVLRSDYQTDYVLMVAEAHSTEQDPALAAQRLAILGSQSPAFIAGEAEKFARESGYPAEDLSLLQELSVAMQTWQPVSGTSLP